MNRLVAAELLKLRTTRAIWGLGISLVVLVGLTAVISIVSSRGARVEPPRAYQAYESARWAPILALVLGMLALGGEFGSGTIAQTFLVTPVRRRVVAAKLVTCIACGVLFAVVAEVVTVAVTVLWLGGGKASPLDHDVALLFLGVLAATALWGGLGVGVAGLVPRAEIAIVGALLWLLVGETALMQLASHVGAYGPGGALGGLMREGGQSRLSMWAGGLVTVCYVAVFAAAGTALTERRDV